MYVCMYARMPLVVDIKAAVSKAALLLDKCLIEIDIRLEANLLQLANKRAGKEFVTKFK